MELGAQSVMPSVYTTYYSSLLLSSIYRLSCYPISNFRFLKMLAPGPNSIIIFHDFMTHLTPCPLIPLLPHFQQHIIFQHIAAKFHHTLSSPVTAAIQKSQFWNLLTPYTASYTSSLFTVTFLCYSFFTREIHKFLDPLLSHHPSMPSCFVWPLPCSAYHHVAPHYVNTIGNALN